jgi:hypothetical protein
MNKDLKGNKDLKAIKDLKEIIKWNKGMKMVNINFILTTKGR